MIDWNYGYIPEAGCDKRVELRIKQLPTMGSKAQEGLEWCYFLIQIQLFSVSHFCQLDLQDNPSIQGEGSL